MADEILYGTEGADLRLAAILASTIWVTIADYSDISSTSMLVGDISQAGSLVIDQPQMSLNNAMAATGEGSSTANTALNTGSPSFTAARQTLVRELMDQMAMTGQMPSITGLAASMVQAYQLRMTDLIAALFPSFTDIVNDTGVTFTVDTFFDALTQLENNRASGEFNAVIQSTQFNGLRNDLRGEVGTIGLQVPSQEILKAKGPGYKANWLGVDIWSIDSCTASGSDYSGAMYTKGAIGHVIGSAPPPIAGLGNVVIAGMMGSPVYVEIERDARKGTSSVVGNAYVGTGINEDALGVELFSL